MRLLINMTFGSMARSLMYGGQVRSLKAQDGFAMFNTRHLYVVGALLDFLTGSWYDAAGGLGSS